MAIKFGSNTDNVQNIVFNNNDVKEVVFDNKIVWERPGELILKFDGASYIKSYSINRTTTYEPTASTGTVVLDEKNTARVYNKDNLTLNLTPTDTSYTYSSWSPASINKPILSLVDETTIKITNYNIFSVTCDYGTDSSFSSSYSVYITDGGSTRISNLSPGTTYYVRVRRTQTRTKYTHTHTASVVNIEPSDFSWSSVNATYIIVNILGTENTTSATDTQTQTLTSSTSSIATKTAYTITFAGPTYGAWDYSSKIAYAGDIISTSGTTVTCYKWNATTTARWTNTANKEIDTVYYSYTTPTISNGSIDPVKANATITAANTRTTLYYTLKAVIVNQSYISDWSVNVGGTEWERPANGATKSVIYGTSIQDAGGIPATSETEWDFETITVPVEAGSTVTSITVLNDDYRSCYLQYKKSSDTSWVTYATAVEAQHSVKIENLTPNTSYDFRFTATASGTVYTYSVDASITDTSTGATVTSMTANGATVTFTGSYSTEATSKEIISDIATFKTSNECTITFRTATNVSGLSAGSWSVTSKKATYGSVLSTSANSILIDYTDTFATYTKGSESGRSSTYSITGAGIVTGDMTITGTTKYYVTAYFTAGSGITSMWYSTSDTAYTGGNSSGTYYYLTSNTSPTIYLYAKTDGKHIPSPLTDWTLATGSCDIGSTEAVFRYTGKTVSSTWNFGTLSSTILYDITITTSNVESYSIKYTNYIGTEKTGKYTSFRALASSKYYITASATIDHKFLIIDEENYGGLALNSYVDEDAGCSITNEEYSATADTTTAISAYSLGTVTYNRLLATGSSWFTDCIPLYIYAPLSSEIGGRVYSLWYHDTSLVPQKAGWVYNESKGYDSSGTYISNVYENISVTDNTTIGNTTAEYPYFKYIYTTTSITIYLDSVESSISGNLGAGHWEVRADPTASWYEATTYGVTRNVTLYPDPTNNLSICRYYNGSYCSILKYVPGSDSSGSYDITSSIDFTQQTTVTETFTITGTTTYTQKSAKVSIEPSTNLSYATFTYTPVGSTTTTTVTLTIGAEKHISNVAYGTAKVSIRTNLSNYGWQNTTTTNYGDFSDSISKSTTYNVTINEEEPSFYLNVETPPCTVTVTQKCYVNGSLYNTYTKTHKAFPGNFSSYRPASYAPTISGYQYSSVVSGTAGYTVQSTGYLTTVTLSSGEDLQLTMKYYYVSSTPSD